MFLKNKIYLGDCLEVMKTFPADVVDTVITDPPYGLEFMGKDWDKGVPGTPYWSEMLRIAKPGALLLSFGGTRTYHRMACAIEDAGWGIRDCMMWLYGSGFPKSLDISKAIDKAKGADRPIIGQHKQSIPQISPRENFGQRFGDEGNNAYITAPATDLAKEWNGWGTALKPAWEPIIVAMKPLDGTFAENAEKWGVAGINVEAGRIGTNDNLDGGCHSPNVSPRAMAPGGAQRNVVAGPYRQPTGRWPANLLLEEGVTDAEWSRFFYTAKASKRERGEGNNHPTVKPIALMEYLCKLTKTPTGGLVLDPFSGSGTTAIACMRTGRDYIGIEKEASYLQIAENRIREEF